MSHEGERPQIIDLAARRAAKPQSFWRRAVNWLEATVDFVRGPESERPFSRVPLTEYEITPVSKYPDHRYLRDYDTYGIDRHLDATVKEPLGPGIHLDLKGAGIIHGGKKD